MKMVGVLSVLVFAGGLSGAAVVHAGESEQAAALRVEAASIIKPFAAKLQATLKQALDEGGVEGGIHACNLSAPSIAAEHSSGSWRIGRTSLKLRNSHNAPDAWELSTLQEFEKRKAAGDSADTLVASALVDGEFRFMKAIATGGVCLTCHGADLSEATRTALDHYYPDDRARGFTLGDLRGAFTLRKALAE